ncbi:hypothetical protein [Embleya scabrispora]|uniref:hypothetical protein n=1 Tax=Embleya scabrispora TaxID=159449 RepID=UPI00117D1233|nr:hypothetical protein [Embleya scabrispora]
MVVRPPLSAVRHPLSPLPSPPGGAAPRPGVRPPDAGAPAVDPCPDETPRAVGATAPDPTRDAARCCRDRLRDRAHGVDPARFDCRGLLGPGRRHQPAPGARTGSAATPPVPAPVSAGPEADPTGGLPPGRPASRRGAVPQVAPPRRAKPPGARDGDDRERGEAAKRAVHDGPAVLARRAITDHVAGTGSGAVLPLGVAAGALLVVGGALVAGARRRGDRPPRRAGARRPGD